MRRKLVVFFVSLMLIGAQIFSLAGLAKTGVAAGLAWPGAWQASSAFYDLWSRADLPVASGVVARSWLWGPQPFAVANEAYAESGTGRRLVEYLDKARMEVNDPSADRNSKWFVTSGLLVTEMVTGRVQTGNNAFEQRPPADVPVAGDPNSPSAPGYAAFSALTAPAPKAAIKPVQQRIAKDGSITPWTSGDAPSDPKIVGPAQYDDVSRHNIPAVFADWSGQTGATLIGGRFVQAPVMDPLFLLGRPITEAYWADVLVAGAPVRVLVQLYERRALTYNPANAPQWRVEMANVGRAYFGWRYGTQSPDPAVSSELTANGLSVHGWNWPREDTVSVRVDLAGSEVPLAGPLDITPDADGRFNLLLPVKPELQGALSAGANVRLFATDASITASLPVAAKIEAGPVHIEGTLTEVMPQPPDAYSLLLTARDGKEWPLSVAATAILRYGEGDKAPASALRPGLAASVDGTWLGGRVSVASLQLLSVSKTGAQFGYTVQPDKKSIRVTGTGWPGEQTVAFSIRRLDKDQGSQLGSAKSDSRGNLAALLKLPAPGALPAGPLWLFAQAQGKSGILASVAQAFDAAGGPAETSGPPSLTMLARSGEQTGRVGDSCWQGQCQPAIGLPVPGDSLLVAAGDVLGMHSQLGPDPETGPTPLSFSGQLYPYPGDPSTQGTLSDGTFYFTPNGQPVFSTGDVPGRPFSVSLPAALPSGKYILAVAVVWPGPSGIRETTSYGFVLQVP